MKQTEAWWVCNSCQQKICKPKSGDLKILMTEHRQTCDPVASCSIRQIEQRKGA